MRLTISLFLLLFSFISLNASAEQAAKCSKGTSPSWVKSHHLSVDAPPVKPSQINLQYLLIDTQRHWEEKTLYRHFAIKALTQSGTESISQIKVDFDPSYAQVVMHDIRVFREGKWHDRLENARYNLIQRETELEQNLYHGDFTLVYFLNDIREGDILEYAYSLVGENPLASSCFTDWVYMQRPFSVEKITHRLLMNPNLSFSTKLVNEEIDPQIQDLSPSLREWVWEATETFPYVEERDQPIWYNAPAHIQMSQYGSWKEVAQNILPLYNLSDGFFSSEMQDLIEKWQKSSSDLSKQALLVLRFVQDEIRYLGFEDGMGAFQPTNPRIALQRRFGDCKDKSFLLHALLKLMGIPSKIVLVHTSRGKMLPDVLPTPFVFNHLVLQLEVDGTIFWVDPTWSLQGGSLDSTFFPDYEWGLILTENTSKLSSLPKPVIENPTEIDSRLAIKTRDLAHLTVKSIFHGANADRLRRSLKWRGSEKISERCLSGMQKVYGAVSMRNDMEVSDDRERNIVTLIEFYDLPTQAIQNKQTIEVFSHTLRNYLNSSVNPQRSSPYEIFYPLWVKEQILIETPFMDWSPYGESFIKTHEAVLYDFSMKMKGNSAFFDFELKHLQDHIPKQSLHDYWQMMNEIHQKGYPTVTVATSPNSSNVTTSQSSLVEMNKMFLCSLAALFVWLFIYFLFMEKRPTQDELSFHLKKFQVFYMIINGLTLAAIGPKGSFYMILPITLIPTAIIHFIMLKRSVRLIFTLQACVLLQTCMIGLCLFMTMPSIHLGQKLIEISIYCLYSTIILTALNRARVYLVREKKVEAVTT